MSEPTTVSAGVASNRREWLRVAVLAVAPILAAACGDRAGGAVDGPGATRAGTALERGVTSGAAGMACAVDGGSGGQGACRGVDSGAGAADMFLPATTLSVSDPDVTFIGVGDFNGDGHADLVLVGYDATLLLGRGDGTFTTSDSVTLPAGDGVTYSCRVRHPALGDFNGDGKPDLIVESDCTNKTYYTCNTAHTGLVVLLGDGAGKLSKPGPSSPTNVTCWTYATATADFYGDGVSDVAVSGIEGRTGTCYDCVYHGFSGLMRPDVRGKELGAGPGRAFPMQQYATEVVAGDFDGDGVPDLMTGTTEGLHTTLVHVASFDRSTHRLGPPTTFKVEGDRMASAFTADMNRDGVADLVVAAPTAAYVALGQCGAPIAPPVKSSTGGTAVVALADFDGDGNVDLLTSAFELLPGRGDGTLGGGVLVEPSGSGSEIPYSVAVGDFNEDGLADLVMPGALGASLQLNAGCGSGAAGVQCGACDGECVAGGCAATFEHATSAVNLAIDPESLYYVVGSRVERAPLGGGAAVTLAKSSAGPNALAVDAANAYWATSDAIYEVPIASGPTTAIVTGASLPRALTSDGSSVYWVGSDGAVMKVPVGGGAATTLATGQGDLAHVAVDAASVYWTSPKNGTVASVPVGGGAPVTLALGLAKPGPLVTRGGQVYFTDGGALLVVATGGGPATTLASGLAHLSALALDAKSAYLVDGGGDVMAVPIGGGAVVTLGSGAVADGFSIAVSKTSLFWTNFDAGIFELTPK